MEIKFKSHASIALEQATIHLGRAQHILTSMGRGAADKLQEARRTGETVLRKLLGNSLDAILVANGKIAQFKSHASIVGEQATIHLGQAQHILTSMGRGAADKLQEARRTGETVLRKLLGNSLDAIVVANGKIAQFKSHASIVGEQATIHLGRAQHILTRLGGNFIDKPRRLQKARRRKENDLRKLVANSLDAIVITDGDRRLVYANPKALDLFGVSELNMGKFTIDTFLSHCQIQGLRRKWFAIRRDERNGRCKIRRLDGCSRVAEYISVANVIPHRYLYRFLNVAPPGITQLAQKCQSATLSTLGNQLISAANVTKQVKPKLGRTRSER